jgi:hypothetical protein
MRFLITRVCAFSSFIASFRVVHLGNFNCISGRLQSDLYARCALWLWALLVFIKAAQQPLPDEMGFSRVSVRKRMEDDGFFGDGEVCLRGSQRTQIVLLCSAIVCVRLCTAVFPVSFYF